MWAGSAVTAWWQGEEGDPQDLIVIHTHTKNMPRKLGVLHVTGIMMHI